MNHSSWSPCRNWKKILSPASANVDSRCPSLCERSILRRLSRCASSLCGASANHPGHCPAGCYHLFLSLRAIHLGLVGVLILRRLFCPRVYCLVLLLLGRFVGFAEMCPQHRSFKAQTLDSLARSSPMQVQGIVRLLECVKLLLELAALLHDEFFLGGSIEGRKFAFLGIQDVEKI